MKLTNKIIAGALGLVLLATATGLRTHSRISSRPSPAVEQQLLQNLEYQEIVSQNSSPLKRELKGMYIDYILPLQIKFTRSLTSEQKRDIRMYRCDSNGTHRPYTPAENATLWHSGANPKHQNIGQDYFLNLIEGSPFCKP